MFHRNMKLTKGIIVHLNLSGNLYLLSRFYAQTNQSLQLGTKSPIIKPSIVKTNFITILNYLMACPDKSKSINDLPIGCAPIYFDKIIEYLERLMLNQLI